MKLLRSRKQKALRLIQKDIENMVYAQKDATLDNDEKEAERLEGDILRHIKLKREMERVWK